jgi:glutathione-regulated potassium-efflux system ancillary protein KefC
MSDLLLTPIVFLLTAVLLVPLAQRLGLGSVLGYLIGGAIVGPWGLSLIQGVDLISHVAEIGVVLMLFLIGLELQPSKLASMRRLVLGGGALQMVSCGGALAVAGWLLGMPWTGALVAGIALALSSTAIAVQSMTERHFSHTPAGKAAFAILLFQDMAAIPLLVCIPLLGAEAGAGAAKFNWQLALAAVACVLVLGKYAIQPLLRLIARTKLREIFTAFALLLVLGIAQLMELADLSMGLGAFLAGVLLAGSEYRKALETDLEPFKGLLLGLFFTSVGMSVNFGLFADAPLRIAALTVGYVLLKTIVLSFTAVGLRIAPVQRLPFAGLLAQGSEFAFVVFAVAAQAKVLPTSWHETLVLVVTISMGMTPIAVGLADMLSKRLYAPAPRAADTIEPNGARVIIAGFGRVGQISGRMLAASGIPMTVLDNDPDLIDMLRRYGLRVFYGDATRLDLLRSAEADKAVLLINAIDDVDASLRLTDLVREHFPQLKMIGRARNLTHLFELRERGVLVAERETFEAALLMGRRALEQLGIDEETAESARAAFREHNLGTLEAMFPNFRDESQRISAAQKAREELGESIAYDRIRLQIKERKSL